VCWVVIFGLVYMIDGISHSGSARRGRKKDEQQLHLLKRRKKARDRTNDLLFEIELKKAMRL
jgi:hypothetical protein